MDIYDETGTLYPANSPGNDLLFESQHNAEYMGDDTYYLFDDGMQVNKNNVVKNTRNSSSCMIIKVHHDDENDVYTAHVVWRYDMAVMTEVRGGVGGWCGWVGDLLEPFLLVVPY